MKRLALLLVLAATLAAPSTATAGGQWYWSEGTAERHLLSRYEVYDAECDGYGKPYKKRLYRKFDCYVTTYDDDYLEVNLRVTGRTKAVVRVLS